MAKYLHWNIYFSIKQSNTCMPLTNANSHDCKLRIPSWIMVKYFQYSILLEKISHNDAYLYLSKKYLIKQYSKKQIMHIIHMNNASQKSNFICKNYVTKVVCMKSINPELLNYYIALSGFRIWKTRAWDNRNSETCEKSHTATHLLFLLEHHSFLSFTMRSTN